MNEWQNGKKDKRTRSAVDEQRDGKEDKEGFLTGRETGLANPPSALPVPVSICRVEKVAKPDGGADGWKP